jgi:3-hydroxybutyryl-CoA dehydrogenase
MATIGILGSGTMGSGIAQLCIQHRFDVLLYDLNEGLLNKAHDAIERSLQKGVELGKLQPSDAEKALTRVHGTTQLAGLAAVDFVVEAVSERLDVKRDLFGQLDPLLKPAVLMASNTSSLSITAIAAATRRPDRVLGLHFFNPAHLMALVEVVRGDATSQSTVDAGMAFARALGKTPVVCKDSPAFVVNRVSRPFYGEALYLLGEGAADAATIDELMKSLGFRMGPFELIDLIGIDINYAVTQSVYEAYFHDPKYRPHPIQQKMADAGLLGRKTKKGFYEYP